MSTSRLSWKAKCSLRWRAQKRFTHSRAAAAERTFGLAEAGGAPPMITAAPFVRSPSSSPLLHQGGRLVFFEQVCGLLCSRFTVQSVVS